MAGRMLSSKYGGRRGVRPDGGALRLTRTPVWISRD